MKIFKTVTKSAFSMNLFFAVSFLLLSSIAYSQSEGIDKNISVGKMKSRAEHATKTGDIYTALFYYEEIIKLEPDDMANRFQIAELYRLTRNYKKAVEAYGYVADKGSNQYPTAPYFKGVMQKMTGDYEEAKKTLLKFKKDAGNISDRELSKLLNIQIAGCDSGIVYREFPDNVKVVNIGNSVNHPHTEFSPVILDSNTMLFGSLRMDTLRYFETTYENTEKQPLRQVYLAEKEDTSWVDKGKFESVNDPQMEMGNLVYSPNSGRYYFSKCSKDSKEHVTCAIYYTEEVNGKFITPVRLPDIINLKGYTTTQPAIMFDTVAVATTTPTNGKTTPNKAQPGKTTQRPGQKPNARPNNRPKPVAKPNITEYLYFVSDRPGGKGGLDIWYTSYNDVRKKWTDPVNFATVNTSEMECTPFYHVPTQTFYFSSSGYASAGGLDIFKIQKDGRRYTKPQNLSFPINSPQDELDFKMSNDGKKGFLVSNRPGGTPYFHETCCDDIYSFEVFPTKPFNCELNLSIAAPDSISLKDQVLLIRKYDARTNNTSVDSVKLKNGDYNFALSKNQQYTFEIQRKGFTHDSMVVETRESAASVKIKKVITLKPLEKKVIEKPIEGKAFVLKDVQYDTDQDTLNPVARAVIDTILLPFLIQHPDDEVQISSHTDDQGSHKYNINLSQRRASNVVKYLVSKGIKIERLHGKGYGETKPIAPNQNPDGSDNPIGRSLNRRTEFLLTKPMGK